jgi:DNA-binding transcriptional MerR regulator
MDKSPDAFRTISEVADTLDLPQHVLRFWETRFPHIRPLKRGGGRRYYRPDDVDLLRVSAPSLRRGLHDQRRAGILKEEGPRFVSPLAEANSRWRHPQRRECGSRRRSFGRARDRPAQSSLFEASERAVRGSPPLTRNACETPSTS